MKKTALLIIIVLLLSLTSCAKLTAEDMRFYVVDADALSTSMSDSEVIKTAKNQGRLVFDGNDIIGYNWKTHTIMLREEAVTSVGTVTEQSGGSALFKVDDTHAFVFVLGNTLIYTGGFEQGSKNPNVPMQPYIKDKTRYSFEIGFDSKYADGKDNRSNAKLYNFLESSGMLSSKTE